MEHRFKRNLPRGGMPKRMLSRLNRTEKTLIRWQQISLLILHSRELRWQSKPFNLSKVRITIFGVGAHGSMFGYSRAAKCPPSWSMDFAPRYSRIYNAVDRLARKCLRWQPESFELQACYSIRRSWQSHYLDCVQFHPIRTPELHAKNYSRSGYWTCRKLGGWDLDSVSESTDCPWTAKSWAIRRL